MASDCAFELRKFGVSMVSLWPGPVNTKAVTGKIIILIFIFCYIRYVDLHDHMDNSHGAMYDKSESIEFPGLAVAHLAADSNKMNFTGRIVSTADLARHYGFTDIDGRTPVDLR